MLVWLFLVVLLTAEAGAIAWWLRKEFYPVLFNGWAVLIYSVILAFDFVLTWLVSQLVTPGGSVMTAILALGGILLVIIVAVLTLFFRWAIRQDMT